MLHACLMQLAELVPYMKAAEHFTGADPFRVNDTRADPKSIFPSQGTNGPIEGSYNSGWLYICALEPPDIKLAGQLGTVT